MSRRVVTRALDHWVDPERVFIEVYGRATNAFWLDSGRGAALGTSYLGAGEPVDAPVDLPSLIDDLRERRRAAGVVGADSEGFALGWVGWLSYEFGAAEHGVDTAPTPLPGAALLWVTRAIAFDHRAGVVTLLALEGEPDAEGWLERTGRRLEALRLERPSVLEPFPLARAARIRQSPAAPSARWRHDPADYARLVRECQESIRRGDAYQLCLTNEITAEVHPDPLGLYLAVRGSNASHHGGYLRIGGVALVSASPERFLRVDAAGAVETKPIKGTRPRGLTAVDDERLKEELLASDKERAENLMIVDLMRNDLSRVAQLGSVEVTSLLAIESYSSVHQLVSTVTARLAPDADSLDAVAALFPAGSMTGAPKISAMRILNGLEGGARGIYAGVFGYLSLDGALDLAMVIRSVVLTPRGASIGTGGGITALSIAEDEVEETRIKARPLLDALGL
ncbi:anthranilate synthase component I family protein [Agreia pratensis]|uniref:Anthranilate synthase component 1 n=1 Tax=Agreia pratensis TaxID=150121 RepID=A0A1X7KYU9_9MICO|nr:anthranilate synthase component I family protein [Agreia pratensis]SMG46798.1 anthranilate synthase component 1 [Agreia pratensis]